MELCITRGKDILRSNQVPIKQRQAGTRHHRDQRSELAGTQAFVARAFGGPCGSFYSRQSGLRSVARARPQGGGRGYDGEQTQIYASVSSWKPFANWAVSNKTIF